jgi:AAA family ATPase
MSEARVFTLRPLAKAPRSDLRDSFRVYLSSSSLAYLKLSPGSLCSLHLEGGVKKTAIAWNAVGDIKNTVVQTTSILQERYGIKLGEKLTISRIEVPLNEAEKVHLEECSDPDKLSKYGPLTDAEISHWEWALEYPLLQCGVLSVDLVFETEIKGQCRAFKVVGISTPSVTDQTISLFTERSGLQIGGNGPKETETKNHGSLKVTQEGLGGLSGQVQRINEMLVDFNLEALGAKMPGFYRLNRGILIHGPKGTGKSSLLRQIESAGWRKSFLIGSNLRSSDGEAKLRKIFKDASQAGPSVILIDQIDFIAPKRTSLESSSLANALCESIDALGEAKVLVVAATRHPNDVDDSLRTPHRLSVEIEVSIPTAAARKDILCAIRDQSSEPSDSIIDFMAEKTHGYVGADLFALLQMTCRKARDRLLPSISLESTIHAPDAENPEKDDFSWLVINEDDVIAAMQEVRPTAMREVFLETPKVKWSDIGGQHALKKHLQKMVERPLKV